MKLFEWGLTRAWAMKPEWVEILSSIAQREPALSEDELASLAEGRLNRYAVAREAGRPLDGADDVYVRNGVAIFSVIGPITRYASFFSRISGATSVESLAADFHVALNSPNVRAILFYCDSPGGDVTGVAELAGMFYAARGQKPMAAYAGGDCCSAAYWLMSAVGKIVVDSTAQLGSIGVYGALVDTTERDEKNGIRRLKIVSSQSPRKAMDPKTEAGRSHLQELVDASAAVFVRDVARFRGVEEETVLEEFGQGGCFIGQAAVDAGLADEVGTFEGVLEELAEAGSGMPLRHVAREGTEERRMGLMADIQAALAKWGHAEEGQPPQGAQPHAQPPAQPTAAPQAASREAELQAELNREREERRQLEARIRQDRQERIEAEAETWASAQVTERRALPAEKESLKGLYLQAAQDDATNPLAAGEDGKPRTRVGQLKATVEARPQHQLTQELVKDAKVAGYVLPTSQSAQDDAEAIREQARKDAEQMNGQSAGKGR